MICRIELTCLYTVMGMEGCGFCFLIMKIVCKKHFTRNCCEMFFYCGAIFLNRCGAGYQIILPQAALMMALPVFRWRNTRKALEEALE